MTTETTKFDTVLRVESTDYAWSECGECGNTIKFGPGENPSTVCPGCGARHEADRAAKSVTVTRILTDDESWAELDADLDY